MVGALIGVHHGYICGAATCPLVRSADWWFRRNMSGLQDSCGLLRSLARRLLTLGDWGSRVQISALRPINRIVTCIWTSNLPRNRLWEDARNTRSLPFILRRYDACHHD